MRNREQGLGLFLWIQLWAIASVVDAFCTTNLQSHQGSRIASQREQKSGGHIPLFVQQFEPQQQEDCQGNDPGLADINAEHLYFAEGDPSTVGFPPEQTSNERSEPVTQSKSQEFAAEDVLYAAAAATTNNNGLNMRLLESPGLQPPPTTTMKSTPVHSAPKNTMFRPKTPSAGQELLEAVLDVTVAGSMALLKGLRYTAATALTASLPDEERKELLTRMKPGLENTETTPKASVADSPTEEEEEERGTVQEEIALAVIEEARKDKLQWQQEKEKITRQLETAAEARIQSELAVQRQRMKKEKELWQEQSQRSNEEAAETLRQNIASLEADLRQATLAQERIRVESSAAIEQAKSDLAKQQQDQIVFETTKELKQVEALLKKRKEQQTMLEKVEKDLRERASQIMTDKEELLRLEKSKNDDSDVTDTNYLPRREIPHLSPKEYRALSQQEKGSLKNSRDSTKAARGDDVESAHGHPILGPVVADLGYKKIYLVPSGKLGTIPIWKRQRTYRNDRARRMATDKQSTMHLGFPGIVCLHEDIEGGLSILDGQHRVGMMQALREIRNRDEEETNKDQETYFQKVLVEVYSEIDQDIPELSINSNSGNHNGMAEQVFVEINKAEPLKMLDMPGVASTADRKLITEAVETLRKQFPKMFSTSQRCRSPNVNIDNMRNSIYGANILQRHKQQIDTSNHLVEWLLERNAALGETYERDPEKQGFLSPKVWNKASKHCFYLGLENSWLFL